jgi:hypothetical protein
MQVSVMVHLLMHRQIHFSVIFTGIRLQCCKSIVILSLHKGWPWVNNFLIVGGIWPHFQKWAAVLKTSNNTLPENPFVEGLVQILGAYLSYHSSALFEVCSFPGEVVSQFPVCLKSSAQDIVNTLASLLQGQHSVHGERIFPFSFIPESVFPSVPLGVQSTVVESLLLLAPFMPNVAATCCVQWVKQHPSNPLKHKVNTFIQVYRQQFPFLESTIL